MPVFVYKSLRKPDTYLYLPKADAFASLPETVAAPLQPWQFVLEFELAPGRRLARVDAAVLRANLYAQGFHLQFPPSVLDPLVAGGVGDG
ncbi:MAG: hypothetical protein RIS67_1226 [Pseudomonadota bacterium]|jgi:uncharacterized protein YcgL (UPF0745 family)